jgi:hypothetical protein
MKRGISLSETDLTEERLSKSIQIWMQQEPEHNLVAITKLTCLLKQGFFGRSFQSCERDYLPLSGSAQEK